MACVGMALLVLIGAGPATAGERIRAADATWRLLGFYDLGKTAKSHSMFHQDVTTAGRFVMVAYEIESGLDSPDRIFRHSRIRDERGRSFERVDGQSSLVPEGKKTIEGEQLPPGVPKEFWAVYEVAANSAGFMFEARSMSAFGDPQWVALGAPQPWPPPAAKKARRARKPNPRGCSKLYAMFNPGECQDEPAAAEEVVPADPKEKFVRNWLLMPQEERKRRAPTLEWDHVNALPAADMLPEEMARWSELNEARMASP